MNNIKNFFDIFLFVFIFILFLSFQLKAENYFGIGIHFSKYENYAIINYISKNGPADKAGLKINDLISHINEKNINNLNLDQIANLIKGTEGSLVKLTIIRENEKSKNILISREKIEIPDIVKAIEYIDSGDLSKGYEILIQLAQKGDAEAQYIIGQINGLDRYGIYNYEESFYWTKLSAEQNFPEAQFYLAILYSEGKGVKKDLSLSHKYFLESSNQNYPQSYPELAYNFYYGEGVNKDINKAIKWWKKTINFPVPILEFSKFNTFNAYQGLYYIYMWEENFIDYKQAYHFANLLLEERGEGTDYDRIAYMLQFGYGINKNITKAEQFYQIAVDKGDLYAKKNLADLYFFGDDDIDTNYVLAFKMYEDLLAEIEFKKESLYERMGDYYRYGYGTVNINYELSLSYYKKAYNTSENPFAAKAIAEMYLDGLGIEKNVKKAIYWFEIALKSPFARSLSAESLAEIYEFGAQDISIDLQKAFHYYKIAADENYSNGSFAVGRFLEEGIHGIQNLYEAAYWYQKSAEEGLSTGALKLAELYRTDKLGKNKDDEANYWFEYSLNMQKEQGLETGIVASKILGLNYINGIGVVKDVDLGLDLLTQASLLEPSIVLEFSALTKNKIINKKKAKEIFDIISKKSKDSNNAKVSLAFIYYADALYIKQDLKKFESLLKEVIKSPYEKNDIFHAYAYVFLGIFYGETNFEKGEAILRKGLIDEQTKSIDKFNSWSIDFIMQTLNMMYNYNGYIYKAELLSKQILSDPNFRTSSSLTKNIASCSLIDSLNSQHKYDEALNFFKDCYKFTEDISGSNSTNLKYKLLEIILLAKTENVQLYEEKYLSINNDLSFFYENLAVWSTSEIVALDAIANFYMKNYKKSYELFQILENNINTQKDKIYDNTLIFATDYLKLLMKIDNHEKALVIAQRLIHDRLERGSIQSLIKKKYLLHDFHEVYIELLFNQQNQNKDYLDESLIVSQLSKNSELSKYIQNSLIKLSLKDKNLKELFDNKQKLEFEMNNLFSKNEIINNNSMYDNILEKNKIWNRLNKNLMSINKKIEKLYPDYFNLLEPKLYTKDQIQKMIKHDEVIITTFTGLENTYIWFIFKDYIYLQQINIKKSNLNQLIKELRFGLDQSNIVNATQLKPFDINLSNQLFKMIFKNVINKITNINKMYFVLDGPFQSLPLEVLVTNKKYNNYTDVSWLLNDYETSYLTSVNDFISLKKENRSTNQNTKNYIAFADPVLDANISNTRSTIKIKSLFDNRGIINMEEIKNLPSLPETSDEVKIIAKILKANMNDIYLQNEANENNVKSINLYNSKVISFATHGLISGEIKGLTEPALVLTPPDTITDNNDGLLKSSEIAILDLNSELVVLSACNTASSDGSLGAEGLSGLAKSFFYCWV